MTLSHKARLAAALSRSAVDRLPTQINYTWDMGQALAGHYGVAAEELPALLDNHLVRVDLATLPASAVTASCVTTGGARGTTRWKKATSSATARWRKKGPGCLFMA